MRKPKTTWVAWGYDPVIGGSFSLCEPTTKAEAERICESMARAPLEEQLSGGRLFVSFGVCSAARFFDGAV